MGTENTVTPTPEPIVELAETQADNRAPTDKLIADALAAVSHAVLNLRAAIAQEAAAGHVDTLARLLEEVRQLQARTRALQDMATPQQDQPARSLRVSTVGTRNAAGPIKLPGEPQQK